MVVVRPVCDDDVRFPIPDAADHLTPDLDAGKQFAAVIFEDLVFVDPQPTSGLLSFFTAPLLECSTGVGGMAVVSPGGRHELHVASRVRPLRRSAARLQFAIVGMRSDHQDSKLCFRIISHRGLPLMRRYYVSITPIPTTLICQDTQLVVEITEFCDVASKADATST